MLREFAFYPLTLDRWSDFEQVMGPQGACYGCWCSYFAIPLALRRDMSGSDKKAHMLERVRMGPPPGLLAYDEGRPVGWVQVTPRKSVVNWNSPRTVSRPLSADDADDPGCWAVSCFFIASGSRGKGLSHALLDAAVRHVRDQGARMLEACPINQAKHSKSVGLFVGPTNIFKQAGFREVALRKEGRPLMRLEFSAPDAANGQQAAK